VKYGALASERGRIEVVWTIEDSEYPARLRFSWTESGLAHPVAAPARRGFGTELIERTLAYELAASAELRIEPTGVRCMITLPLTEKLIFPRTPP
jgi:two-component system CheB/CheR fusion protein